MNSLSFIIASVTDRVKQKRKAKRPDYGLFLPNRREIKIRNLRGAFAGDVVLRRLKEKRKERGMKVCFTETIERKGGDKE